MADMLVAHCESCGLGPHELTVGGFMRASFFTSVAVWCARCEVVGDSSVFVGVRELSGGIGSSPQSRVVAFPKDNKELAELILETHRRPSCARCGKRARRMKGVAADKHPDCPRCEGGKLTLVYVGSAD